MSPDVLVLGAGPAGASVAIHLARAGHSVVIADKKDFPRQKPCGEFLSPECVPYLEELGVADAVRDLAPWQVRGMAMHAAGHRALGRFRRVGTRGAHALTGMGIRREVFDHVLLRGAEAAGAQWLPRHEFVDLVRAADGRVTGARLRTGNGTPFEVRAKWVVGADGVNSGVARDLGVRKAIPWLDRFALAAHFEGVAPDAHAEAHLFPGGFLAATTVDQSIYSVNLIVPRSHLRQRKSADWDEFVSGYLDHAPALKQRLASARRISPWRGIGPMASTTTHQWQPGAALVGDACGYVDPLTGEGIYFALVGGRALGASLASALATPRAEASAMGGYVEARRREIEPRLQGSMMLQRLLRRPLLVKSFFSGAERWQGLADLVVTLTGDTIHPRDLVRPSFWRAFRGAEVA